MSENGGPVAPRSEKGAAAFRTIGEVADDLDVSAHVLRFWESKFPQLKPLKRGGGRRYYRPEDIALLRRIRQSLYEEGYTIRGVQQMLGTPSSDDGGTRAVAAVPSLFPLDASSEPDSPGSAPDSPAPDSPAPPETPGRRRRPRPGRSPQIEPDQETALQDIRRELIEARALLEQLLQRRRGP